jgi:MATE family multidrug resistance protein
LQVATVLFMVPFGISLAATVRVGHAVGRRDAVATRRAGFIAIALGAVFMLATTLAVVVLRNAIPLVFLGGEVPAGAETTRLAATLLLIGASFFVADAVQGVAAGALRGLNDTRMPMLYAAVSFWLVGFSSAYALAFPLHFGAVGIWIGFSLGVTTFAVLLVWRFHLLTLRGYLPAAPHSGAAHP